MPTVHSQISVNFFIRAFVVGKRVVFSEAQYQLENKSALIFISSDPKCFHVGYALINAKTTALYEQVPVQINIVDLEINSPLEPEIMISNYEVAFLNAVAERFKQYQQII
ncbi:hypothetical protein DAPPUDRAFT_246892 [Daphnia pulex]|uniref:Uncharacterized protein n=1 Tax=Daphnia pulex TaxID=6669 RepID=E9GRD9_DAPPU|nr:hypothetical protein DAPPUDRAFT_246892 [Daphnia pulex]|eukprot:EFX78011.1 hypothetical protein DAPPUDRAFT_246892 [Daphnia pulex]